MIIKVLQEHIDEELEAGTRCTSCPVARAIQPLLKEPLLASVVRSFVRIYPHKGTYFTTPAQDPLLDIFLPVSAKEWIGVYDRQGPGAVKPFEFELDIPVELLKGK